MYGRCTVDVREIYRTSTVHYRTSTVHKASCSSSDLLRDCVCVRLVMRHGQARVYSSILGRDPA